MTEEAQPCPLRAIAMEDLFSFWIILVIAAVFVVATLWTREICESGVAASMTARGFADAAAAARCNLDRNPLRSFAWQAQCDRGPFEDLEAALSASRAATFEQAIRTIQVGAPVGALPHQYVL